MKNRFEMYLEMATKNKSLSNIFTNKQLEKWEIIEAVKNKKSTETDDNGEFDFFAKNGYLIYDSEENENYLNKLKKRKILKNAEYYKVGNNEFLEFKKPLNNFDKQALKCIFGKQLMKVKIKTSWKSIYDAIVELYKTNKGKKTSYILGS